MTLVMFLGGVQASAAADVNFTVAVEKPSYFADQRAEVTIAVTELTAAGFYAKLNYDASVLSLVQTTVNDQLFHGLTANIKAGELILAWSSGENKVIPAGIAVTFQFEISPGAAVQDYAVALEILELMDEEFQPVSHIVSNGVIRVVNRVVSAEAQKVIGLIEEIGTMTAADDATGEKIKNAKETFLKLSAEEKKQVSNYETLVAANSEYQRLKEQKYADDNAAALQGIIDKFKTDYARVIALEPAEAKADDLAQVNEALAEYAQQSAYIRRKLEPEQKHLLEVKAWINQMIEAAEARAVAEEMAAGYREQFSALLNASADTVVLDPAFKAELEAALSTYEDAFTPLAQELLRADYAHIQAMLNAYLKLEAENSPEPEEVINAYNAFREKYRSILLMSELEVTEEDADTLDEALSDYYAQSNQVKGKLANEFEHILNLCFALELAELEEEETPGDGITDEEIDDACDDFRDKYAAVLGKTEENVALEDAGQLNAALAEYYTLDYRVRGKLSEEFEQIMKLLFALKLADQPGDDPTEPTDKPTEPTDVPTEPTDKPTEPTDVPTEPTDEPTEPTDVPTEPTDKPTEPTDKPTEPTDKPTEPTDAPTEPTVDSSDAEITAACDNFREKYAKVLDKTEENVILADAQQLNAALAEYFTLDYRVKGKLDKEFEHIMKLLFALRLAEQPTGPDDGMTDEEIETACRSFREKYSDVLGKTEETVTAADAESLRAALAEYRALDVQIKEKLGTELELITKLLAVLELNSETDPTVPTEPDSNIVYKPGSTNVELTVWASLSENVKTLLWVMGAAVLLVSVSVVSYILIRRKSGKEESREE